MTVLAAVMMAASISEATLLRMGAMPVAPKIDNVISREEECAASTQYGLVSHDNGDSCPSAMPWRMWAIRTIR